MRDTKPVSKWDETGVSARLHRRSRSVILFQLGVALIAVNACAERAWLSSSQGLFATDPRAIAQWLETNRPKPVTVEQKARILSSLPREGEVTYRDASRRRKLAALQTFLRATGHASAYDIKVIEVPQARIGIYERTVVLIPEIVLTLLDTEELQAQLAHEIGHQYLLVGDDRSPLPKGARHPKDVELLCDAIAIVTLHGLNLDPSRLMTGVEKITRYNWNFLDASVERRSYPSLSERQKFARQVVAWLSRRALPPSPE